MRYSVVLLDVGRTLIGPRESFGAVYERVLGSLGWRFADGSLDRSIRQVSEEMKRRIPPGVDRFSHFPGGEDEFWLRFLHRVLELSGASDLDPPTTRRGLDGLREAFRLPQAWEVYADVPPMLEALAALGVRLGIVSNWDSRLPELLETLGLAGHFDAIGVSHLERVEKPDPALFHRVLDRLDAGPEDALHVGDIPDLDLEGALAAGIDVRLVDRAGGLADSYRPLRDLSGLPEIVRRSSV